MHFDLTDLRLFSAVAEAGSITRYMVSPSTSTGSMTAAPASARRVAARSALAWSPKAPACTR